MFRNSKWLLTSMLMLTLSTSTLAQVKLGIDQLFEQPYIQWVKGKSIALVTNLASRDSHGKSTYDILRHNHTLHLSAVFTPEHGLKATADQRIQDPSTGASNVPIYSLYGPRNTPTAQQLQGIDVIVYDLQDVGLRYYTFNATLGHLIQQAAKLHIPVVILDRPDPLGEHVVSGNRTADKRVGHFTSFFAIPTRYGLTPAELAINYNRAQHIGATLHIVPLKGWKRSMLWPQTGLHWYAPSPALTTFKQVYLYAMIGPVESLRLAVGRGLSNRHAFSRIGAPYISQQQAQQLARKLNQYNFAHLYFTATAWHVTRGIFRGKTVHGIEITLGNLSGVNPSKVQYTLIQTLYRMFGDKIKINGIDGMEGSKQFRHAIQSDHDYTQWLKNYKSTNSKFVDQSYHLYPN